MDNSDNTIRIAHLREADANARRRSAGVAIVTVLAVLTVMALLAMCFAVLLTIEMETSRMSQGRVQSDMMAQSGIQHALCMLRQDVAEQPGWDDPSEPWHARFSNSSGTNGHQWVYVRGEKGNVVGRYAVEIEDESGKININAAAACSTSEQNQGVGTFEIMLADGKGRGLPISAEAARRIVRYRYGPDGKPGRAGIDDNLTASLYQNDEIDNNANGTVDEPGEGIDEPEEYSPMNPRGDDRVFMSVNEMIGTSLSSENLTAGDRLALMHLGTTASRSRDMFWDRRDNTWQNRVNINVADKYQMMDVLARANADSQFEPESHDLNQLCANIQDYRDHNHVLSTVGNEYGVEAVCFNEVMANDGSMAFQTDWDTYMLDPAYGTYKANLGVPTRRDYYSANGNDISFKISSLQIGGNTIVISLSRPTKDLHDNASTHFFEMDTPWEANFWKGWQAIISSNAVADLGTFDIVTSDPGDARRLTLRSSGAIDPAISVGDIEHLRFRIACGTGLPGWEAPDRTRNPNVSMKWYFPPFRTTKHLDWYYRAYFVQSAWNPYSSGSTKTKVTELDVDGDTSQYVPIPMDQMKYIYQEGKAQRPCKTGYIPLVATTSKKCRMGANENDWEYGTMVNYVLLSRPDIVELFNVSDKPISLRNWSVVVNTGADSLPLDTITSGRRYSPEFNRGRYDDPNPVIKPNSYAYLTSNEEIFDIDWGNGSGFYGDDANERLPLIELPEKKWGITYPITKVEWPYNITVDGAFWTPNIFKNELAVILTDRIAPNYHTPNGIVFTIYANTKNVVRKASGWGVTQLGIERGDKLMIFGLPRKGGFVSFTLKNEYRQVAARTVTYGTVEFDQFGYSTQKYDPTHYTWVTTRNPSIGGTEEKARNKLSVKPGYAKPHIKNNNYVSPAELLNVRRSKNWENLGSQDMSATRRALQAITPYTTVNGIRLDPEEEGVHLNGWKPAFGVVRSCNQHALVADHVNWPPGLWRGQKLRILSGRCAGKEYMVTNSTMDSIQICGLSSDGTLLNAQAYDQFSVGPGYGTALFYARNDDDAGEWEWKNKDIPRGSYGLYLFGLNDSILTTEFLEENWNAELEPFVFNYATRAYDPLPLDRGDGGSLYRMRSRTRRFRYGKDDGVFCGMIGPEHISSHQGIKLKLIPHSTGQKKCSGFAWFDYAYLAPGPTEGKININTAPARVLSSLKGVTPSLASNIVHGLPAHGTSRAKPYHTGADVLDVQGITPDIYSDICNLLTTGSEQFRVKVVGQALINKDGIYDEKKGDKVVAESRLDMLVDRGDLMNSMNRSGMFRVTTAR